MLCCSSAWNQYRETPSSRNRRIFVSIPPGPLYPPSPPSIRTTRWQGIYGAYGFFAIAFATARTALGLPIC